MSHHRKLAQGRVVNVDTRVRFPRAITLARTDFRHREAGLSDAGRFVSEEGAGFSMARERSIRMDASQEHGDTARDSHRVGREGRDSVRLSMEVALASDDVVEGVSRSGGFDGLSTGQGLGARRGFKGRQTAGLIVDTVNVASPQAAVGRVDGDFRGAR